MVKNFRNQKYSNLRKDHQQRREKFVDPEFPPEASSLFLSGKNEHDIVWKRPSELCDDPHLVVNGLSSSDLNQGFLGNCWFVAACSALALESKLWDRVVPSWRSQDWDPGHTERDAGIFRFRFWRLGEWMEVVVDDLLPTKNGELVYMRSKDKNEYWSPLLEKAYAKLSGSYEALSGGLTGDALMDFTGGVNESIDLQEGGYSSDHDKMTELFERLEKAHDRRALISCSIALKGDEAPETALDCGLIKGHAYCVTDVRKVKMTSGLLHKDRMMMIRVRNPWGQKEWNGAWSDESEEWKKVSKGEREKIGIKIDDDGEFWMECIDWCSWFTDVSICYIVNTRILSLQKTWSEALLHSQWKGRSAGGCVNSRETFLHNPQFVFDIQGEDSEVMVSLIQKDARAEKTKKGRGGGGGGGGLMAGGAGGGGADTGASFSIGFFVMRVEENRKYKTHVVQEKAAGITFTNKRSVFGKFTLSSGRYVVVPSTFDPGQERPFLLRIFTESANHAKELKRDVPAKGCCGYLCCCCVRYPQALVTVHIDSAQGLQKQDIIGAGADPLCILKCERTKAQTHVKRNTLDPVFKSRFSFYVKNPASSELKFQVWNSNLLIDRFMGQVIVPLPRDGESERHTKHLMGRGRHSDEEQSGTVTFRVECSHNLRAT